MLIVVVAPSTYHSVNARGDSPEPCTEEAPPRIMTTSRLAQTRMSTTQSTSCRSSGSTLLSGDYDGLVGQKLTQSK